jgi:uncharacterized delta-60 repeat protein
MHMQFEKSTSGRKSNSNSATGAQAEKPKTASARLASAIHQVLNRPATFERLENRTLMSFSAGTLDNSFNTAGPTPGVVSTSISGADDEAVGLTIQSADHKIVVAGNSASNETIELARYNPDGSLDSSFGSNGLVTTSVANGIQANAITMDSSGNLYVTGTTIVTGDGYDIAVVKYSPSGQLVTGFGTGGIATIDFQHKNDAGNAIVIDPSTGNVVVAGDGTTSSGNREEIAIATLNENTGALIAKTLTAVGTSGNDQANSIVIQGSDYLVGGYATMSGTSHFALARYSSSLVLDNSFGTGGTVSTALGSGGSESATSIAIGTDSTIYAAGSASGSAALANYTANGSLIASFIASSGSGFAQANGLAVQYNGKIILTGYNDTASTDAVELARITKTVTGNTTALSADTTFGTGGYATTAYTAASTPVDAEANAVAIDSTGKAVIAGTAAVGPAGSPEEFTVARYVTDNAPTAPSGSTATFDPIDQSETQSPGNSVTSLVSQLGATDADGDTVGVAITSLAGVGTWQYSTNSGTSWTAITGVSDSNALVLTNAASNLIRFVPTGAATGTASIGLRLYDQTQAYANGSFVNAYNSAGTDSTANSGPSALNLNSFSDATFTASVTVGASPSTVYVNSSWAGDSQNQTVTDSSGTHHFGIDAFATIQNGVNFVATGGTVYVDAGTYSENVVVNKSISILGPNASINPNTGTRVAEAVVQPGLSSSYDTSSVITVEADNVTIAGLTVVGTIASPTGGQSAGFTLTSGTVTYAATGISNAVNTNDQSTVVNVSGVTVQNNILSGFTQTGVYFDTNSAGDVPSANNSISYNAISNVPNNGQGGYVGEGVIIYDDFYANINGNVITGVRTGIQTGNNWQSVGSFAPSISNNSVSASVKGIYFNLQYDNATPFTVSGNTITQSDPSVSPAYNVGLLIQSIQGSVSATVSGNNVSGFLYGVEFAGNTATVTLEGGTLSDNTYGVWATNNDYFYSANYNTSAALSGVAITGSTSAGIFIDSTSASSSGTTDTTDAVTLSIGNGTSVSGGPTGLLVAGSLSSVGGGTLNDTTFTGQTNYIVLSNGAEAGQTLNATGVTFGAATAASGTLSTAFGIENKITDYLDDPSLGYVQISTGNVYVTQASETDTAGALQRGVNVAVTGDTVNVQAGTYVGANVADTTDGVVAAVAIGKSISLIGPNPTFNPTGSVPASQAIILPGISDPFVSDPTESVGIEVLASNVTIKGITFDGSNPGLSSHDGTITLNGKPIDSAEGIVSYRGVGGITVSNNIIQDTAYSGVDFYNNDNGNAATSDNTISSNLIQNLSDSYGFGVGVLLYDNFYAQVTGNVISNVNVGVQTGNYFLANSDSSFAPEISGNKISADAVGIFFNLSYESASTFTVASNSITAVYAPSDAPWQGVLIGSILSATSVTFQNNTIDGSLAYSSAADPTAGYEVWNTPTTGNVLISGGTVTGVDYGVWVNSYEGYNSNAAATQATISGVGITASQIGVYVEDSPQNTTPVAVSATIEGNTDITTGGSGTGILVSGATASADITGNHDSIYGNVTGIDVSGGSATISDNHIYDNTTGIDFTAGGSGSVASSNFSGGTFNSTDLVVDTTAGLVTDGGGNSFAGSQFINDLAGADTLNASTDTFNVGASGAQVGGSALTVAEGFAIEDRVSDYLDNPGLGYVELNTTNVYVDQLSETTNAGAIQRGINKTPPSGTVNVGAGTFTGSPQITESLTLSGAGEGSTTIDLAPVGTAGTTYLAPLYIAAPGGTVTVEGFTVVGNDAAGSGLANSDIYLESDGLNTVNIDNDKIESGQIGSGSTGDDGFGIITGYTTTPADFVGTLNVSGSAFVPVDSSGSARGFYINPGVENFNFTGNTITGDFTEDSITEANNALIQDNTITGDSASNPTPGIGAYGYPDANGYGHANIIGNTFNDNSWGVAIYSANDVTVRNNLFTNDGIGVWVTDTGGVPNFDPSTDTINDNSFGTSNSIGVQNDTPTTVDASKNWWGSINGPTSALNTFDVGSQGVIETGPAVIAPWLSSGHNNAAAAEPGFYPDAGTSTAPVTDTTTGGEFSTIQAAVTAAHAGDTIDVSAGTYVEQVTIDKDLTLTGAGTSTVIESPATLDSSFVSGGVNYDAVVAVLDANATIENLEINGLGNGNANYRFVGLGFHNAGGAATDLTVTGTTDTPLDGAQGGYGIIAREDVAGTYSLSITGNIINDYQKNGVDVRGSGLSANVSGNTITGAGQTGVIAQNGIVAGFGAQATITDNTVSDDSYTDLAQNNATGILLYNAADGSSASGNTVTGSDVGVYAYYDAGTTTITGNQISGSDEAGIVSDGGTSAISDNTLENNTGDGIDLYDDQTGTTLTGDSIDTSGSEIAIGNYSNDNIDASGETFNGVLAGTATTAQQYVITDTIFDGIDASGYGLVTTSQTALYVTPADEASSPGAIGRAEGFAGVNETIHVEGTLTFNTTASHSTYGQTTPVSGSVSSGYLLDGNDVTVAVATTGGPSVSTGISGGAFGPATLDTQSLNANTYTLDYSLTDGRLIFDSTAGSTNTLVVGKATLTITATTQTKTYDGTTSAAGTPTFQVSGEPANTLYGSDTLSGLTEAYESKNVLGTNGSTLEVTGYTLSDPGNYTVVEDTTAGTITPATLTITASGINKVYDGTTAGTVNLSDNHIGNDQITETYGSATFSTRNVGTNESVFVSGITIGGADAGNYTFNDTASTTANITKATLTISAVTNTKTYDGTTAAAGVPTYTGLQTGDSLSGLVEVYSDKNAGTGKTLSVSGYTLSDGNNGGNYTVVELTNSTGVINQRQLTVSATGINKVYDGTTTATVNLSDNRVAGDQFTDTYGAANFNNASVGNGKPVSVTGISISGPDAANYTFNTTASTTANITTRNIRVTGSSFTIAEGSAYTGPVATFTDANGLEPVGVYTAIINWGDNTPTTTGTVTISNGVATVTGTHTYADGPNTYPVTVDISDGSGGTDGTDTGSPATATVTEVNPTLTLSGSSTGTEGSTYTLTLSSSDPGTHVESLSWLVNWGDGETSTVSGAPFTYSAQTGLYTSTVTATHTYVNSPAYASGTVANYTISATATDSDGTYSAGNTVAVAVAYVPPTVPLSDTVNNKPTEASPYTLDVGALVAPGGAGDASHAGVTTSEYIVNWGDNSSTTVTGSQLQSFIANGGTLTHTYEQPISYTITLDVLDSNGYHSAAETNGTVTAGGELTVVVQDVPPTASFSGSSTLSEGSSGSVTFYNQADVSPIATAAGFTYQVDLVNSSTTNIVVIRSIAVVGRSPGNGASPVTITVPSSDLQIGQNIIRGRIIDQYGGYTDYYQVINVTAGTFQVTSFTPTASGFDATFNDPVNLSTLHIYGSAGGLGNVPDVTVVGASTGLVHGSLVWDSSTDTAHFVKTGGPLLPDTYTVTLVSGAYGWTDTTGGALDGADNGGDQNYTSTFIVGSTAGDPTLSIPDFARGPGQTVTVPVSGTSLPIQINNASGVYSVDFHLIYNKNLLNISAATLGSSLPAGWTLTVNMFAGPGQINFTASGPTAISTNSLLTLVNLTATVPTNAAYSSAADIQLQSVSANGGNMTAVAPSTVEKVAYLGDTSGNGELSGADSSLISRVVVGIDSGFNAYPLTDPVIIGNVSGTGTLNGLDAAYVTQASIGLAPGSNYVPAIPTGLTLSFGGTDPTISVPTDVLATRGSNLVVPISISDLTNYAGSNFTLVYNPALLNLSQTSLTLGTLPSSQWQILYNAANGEGALYQYSFNNPDPTGAGTLANITVPVPATANPGQIALNISGDATDSSATGGNLSFTYSNGSIDIPPDFTGRYYTVKLDGSGNVDVWENVAQTATPTYVFPQSLYGTDANFNQLIFNTTASGGSVTIDETNGDPLPAGGVAFNGTGTGNTLIIDGGSGTNTATVSSSGFAYNSDALALSDVQNFVFNAGTGSNTLTQNSQPAGTVAFNYGGGTDDLIVDGGTYTFAAAAPGTGVTADVLDSITIASGARVVVAAPDVQGDRHVMELNNLYIAGSTNAWTGSLDLTGNDLVVHDGNLAQLTNQLASGYGTPATYWKGKGISSSTAAGDPTFLTTLGVELNNNGNGQPLFGSGAPLGTFDGQSPSVTDVLIKYTYYGDANLDGKVDGTDYADVDNGFLNHLTGWSNGDFNYDGTVDGSDYTLIDNAFNMQGAVMSTSIEMDEVAQPTATFSSPSAPVIAPAPAAIVKAPAVAVGKQKKETTLVQPAATAKKAGLAANVFQTQTPIALPGTIAGSIEQSLQKKDLLDGLGSLD